MDMMMGRIQEEEQKWLEKYLLAQQMRGSTSPVKQAQPSGEKFLYQSIDGQRVFLHQLNFQTLCYQAKNAPEPDQKMPPRIKGKVLSIESLTLTPEERKKWRFLSHLPLNSSVCFAELDLDHLLTQPTMEKYGQRLQAKRRMRQAEIRKAEQCR